MKARQIVEEMDSYVPGKSQDEIANDFGLKKDLLYFRGKIIILSSSDSKASRARTEDL